MTADDILAPENLPEGHRSGFVAVVGAPNVGKSTLMNAFLEQKIAIVSPRPQTTRSRQLGILTTDEYQIIFVDTPGLIRNTRHSLDEFMVERVVESVDGSDCVLWLVDGTMPPSSLDLAVAEMLSPLIGRVPVILGVNKIDIMTAEQVSEHANAYHLLVPEAPWVVFSAETRAGLPELLDMLVAALPEGPRFYHREHITDTYVRDIAAEMVREQLLILLRDEVPHAMAVQVNEFKERENGVVYIHATIHVERDAHKKIVIGAKGQQLRQIGADARKEIEKLLDSRVFLELRVKVTPNWRTNRQLIEHFGYS